MGRKRMKAKKRKKVDINKLITILINEINKYELDFLKREDRR